MSEAVVAKRYADALFQLATEKNKIDTFLTELDVVKDVFANDAEVMNFLSHPRLKMNEKMNIIDKAFAKCDQDVKNVVKLLVERQRINAMTLVVEEFIQRYNDANDIAHAIVYSVRELTEDEKAQIEASLKKQLNKQSITIENVIQPSLLGGLRIRVGNTIFDGSISGKLNRMKQSMVSATL